MKKTVVILLIISFIIPLFQIPIYASDESVDVYIDGEGLVTDQSGVILNGRTLVPLRAICEALGCKVSWDEHNREAEITNNAMNIRIKIESYWMIKSYNALSYSDDSYQDLHNEQIVNKYENYYEEIELDVPPLIINNRTLVPVRAISEALYADVNWNAEKHQVEITRKYDNIFGFSEELAMAKKDGKFGFVNMDGDVVIPFMYDGFSGFENGVSCVKLNQKWGIIDDIGKVLVPIEYDSIMPLSRKWGLLAYESSIEWDDYKDFFAVSKSQKWGIIDKDGNIVVEFIYDYINCFSHGLSTVGKEGKTGCINIHGDIVIPFEYDIIKPFQDEGIAMVGNGGEIGFIDTGGEIVIPIEYELPVKISSVIMCTKNGKKGVISKQGHVLIPFEYDEITTDSGICYVVSKNGFWGIVDIHGNVVLPIVFYWISFYQEGFEIFKPTRGSITEGTLVSGPDSHIVVFGNNKYGIIERETLKLIVPNEYDDIIYLTQDIAGVKNGEKWGVVNMVGNIIIPIEYDSVELIEEGKYIRAEKNEKEIYYDILGKVIYKPIEE